MRPPGAVRRNLCEAFRFCASGWPFDPTGADEVADPDDADDRVRRDDDERHGREERGVRGNGVEDRGRR
ncbi:MAG: hypothetical protein ACREQY_15775, partial [Candidatus Binatia bacterium]